MKRALAMMGVWVLLLAGCSREQAPDFYILLSDGKGLVPGSQVVWRGTVMGSVTRVAPEEGKLRADVRLAPEMKGRLHTGIKGRASGGSVPVLELFGGEDPGRPPLAPGARMEEATVLEAFPWHLAAIAAGVVVLLVIVFLIAQGIKKLFALAFAVVLLAFAGFFFRGQWSKYHGQILSADVEARLTEMADSAIHSPEATAAWNDLKGSVNGILDKAKLDSKESLAKVKEDVKARIDLKAAELQDKGQSAAREELENLKKKVEESL